MIARIILIVCIGWLAHFQAGACRSAAPAPKSIRIFPDLQGHWFLDGLLEFGCEVTYTNNGKRRTTGYLNGNLPWKELYCASDQARIQGGRLVVDLYKVRQNNNTLVIHVQHREFINVKASFEIKIPPLQSIVVVIPENVNLRYGSTIEPIIHLDWANGVGYSYKASNRKSLVSLDSVSLFFNNKRVYDGKIELPQFEVHEPHTFTLSAIWTSKPWLYDIEKYPFQASHHTVWKFKVPNGTDARRQTAAPKGMDGAEGFHGAQGSDAPDVVVRLSMSADKQHLQVVATNGLEAFTKEFALDEFSLTIQAHGGNGGNGGRGGEGGPAPFDDPTKAGIGGRGGSAGRGGTGAAVSVESTPEAEAFIPCISVDNADGARGVAGRGGRGGVFASGYGMPTLLDLLFPSRNYDGEPGED